jgi:hypothetical protein
VLASVEFEGLGIFRLDAVRDANEGPARMAADLYCEKMTFVPGTSVR